MIKENKIIKTSLKQNGDFRSPECIEVLKECDIVVTNPPFSLFREYISLLTQHKKEFLIIGNMNAITYKGVFPLIKENKVWLGITAPKIFIQPCKTEKKFGNICWFTNLKHNKRNIKLKFGCKYNPDKYPKYDNYDAINVDKTINIPEDYDGYMGVPISFLAKYNPEQFEIVRFRKGNNNKDLSINGKDKYFRIIIKRN